MLTVTEFAATLKRRGARKSGVSRQHILFLLRKGRIPGAMKIGEINGSRGVWLIPDNAQVLELSHRNNKSK